MWVSALLGTTVVDADGHLVGVVDDLVVDLAVDLDRVPLTCVVIKLRRDGRCTVPWTGLSSGPGGEHLVLRGDAVQLKELSPTEVLVRRDILDSPVVLADPPRRARVSDIVLETEGSGAWVIELDVSTAGALRRLLGRHRSTERAAVSGSVPLSAVHLSSFAGHHAQLAVPGAMVFGLGPEGMAEVLTRVSVAHARDIMRVADRGVLEQAVSLLHPRVRSRVTGTARPPRRTRRLAGWRVHGPRSGHGPGADT